MSMPRRRLVRPDAQATQPQREPPLRLQKLRRQLQQERVALARWLQRLTRAFHSMDKHQLRVRRLERELNRQET